MAITWTDFTPEVLEKIQGNVLGVTTASNPDLAHKAMAAQDKDLHTTAKIVTQAINEVKSSSDASALNVASFNDRFNLVIGNDGTTEATEFANLTGGNLLKAISALKDTVDSIDTSGCGSVDLSNYYDKTEVDELIDNIPETDLSGYYDKTEVDELIDNIPETDLSGYYDKTEVDGLISNVDLSNYYTKSNTYNKTEVDSLIDNIPVVDISNKVDNTFANKTNKYVLGDLTVEPSVNPNEIILHKTAVKSTDGTFVEYDYPLNSPDGSIEVNLSASGVSLFAKSNNVLFIPDDHVQYNGVYDVSSSVLSTISGNTPTKTQLDNASVIYGIILESGHNVIKSISKIINLTHNINDTTVQLNTTLIRNVEFYESTKSYEIGEIVIDSIYDSYVAIQKTPPGTSLSNTTYFSLLNKVAIESVLTSSKAYTDQKISAAVSSDVIGFYPYGRVNNATPFPTNSVLSDTTAFDFSDNKQYIFDGQDWNEDFAVDVLESAEIIVAEMLDGVDILGASLVNEKVSGLYKDSNWLFMIDKHNNPDNVTIGYRSSDAAIEVLDGSITKDKLATALQDAIDLISTLESRIEALEEIAQHVLTDEDVIIGIPPTTDDLI
jgi:hypothetical protein